MAKADSSLPPHERKKYVLDGEKVIFALNQHWLVVAEPVVSVALLLVVAVVADAQAPGNARMVVNVLWWVWFASILRALFMLWEWRREWFIATDKRMLRVYGLIDRQVAMMPLGKVTDMRYERTIPGRIWGYGTFVMESAGQVQALERVDFVPNPDANYRALVAEMFSVADSAKVDSEDTNLPLDDATRDDLEPVYESEHPIDDRDEADSDEHEYGDLASWREFARRHPQEARRRPVGVPFERESTGEEDTGPIGVRR